MDGVKTTILTLGFHISRYLAVNKYFTILTEILPGLYLIEEVSKCVLGQEWATRRLLSSFESVRKVREVDFLKRKSRWRRWRSVMSLPREYPTMSSSSVLRDSCATHALPSFSLPSCSYSPIFNWPPATPNLLQDKRMPRGLTRHSDRAIQTDEYSRKFPHLTTSKHT